MSRTRAATIVVLLYVYALAAFGLWLNGFTEDAGATLPECTTITDCPPDISTSLPSPTTTTTEAPTTTTTTSTPVPATTTTTTPGPVPATILPPVTADLPGAPPAITG